MKRFQLFTIIVAGLLAACSSQNEERQASAPTVSVIAAQKQTVAVDTVLTGRLEASRVAEVRARVSGVLLKRLFEEGSMVTEGQKLFTIDDAPYRAAAASARANFVKARSDMNRLRPLMEAGAVSRQEWDAAVQNYQVSRAARDTADINVGYAHVTAPISGRIGRAEVTEGALVGQGSATLLATIQQDDPLYINFTQSADDVMKMRRAIAEGNLKNVDGEIPVTVTFNDGYVYPLTGTLLFTDPTVDAGTGQVSLRASIPNPDGALFPGLFVTARLAVSEIPDAFLVPQRAVTMGEKNTVTVVNADGTYEAREVRVSGNRGNDWVVTGGLAEGDLIAVDGMSAVTMTGAKKVQTRPWQPDGAAVKTPAAEAQNDDAETPAEVGE